MTTLLLVLLATPSWPDTVPVMDLTFDAAMWEYACDHWSEDIWVDATLSVNGENYPCDFRIRGETSRMYPKKSIKVLLDPGHLLFGHEEFNLNAQYLDHTRIRECLSYLFYSYAGQTVPEVHFTEVLFNGATQGAYLSVEDIDEDFLEHTPFLDDAAIYKCAHRYASLDSVDDLTPYAKKSCESEPWDDLVLLIHWLVLTPDSLFEQGLQARFDVEDLVRCMSINVLLGHGSTYYHNYHLLLDESGAIGPWRYVTWDMDRTWGMYWPYLPYHRNTNNNGTRRNPLIWRMWCTLSTRLDLISKIRELAPDLTAFSTSGVIDSLTAISEPLVEVDPFREFEMDEFQAQVQAIRNWPSDRTGALEEMFSLWPVPYRIHPLRHSEGDMEVSWQGNGQGQLYLVKVSTDSLFENPAELLFQQTTSRTSCTVPGEFTGFDSWVEVYMTSGGHEDRSANGPLRLVELPGPSIGAPVVINEINYLSPPQSDTGDWLELINSSDDTLNLAGWALRDAIGSNLTTLPEILLVPGECTVLPADSLLFSSWFPSIPFPYPLNFGLSAGGDIVRLYDISGALVDYVPYQPESPWPWEAAGYGATLALIDPALPNSLGSSWAAGIDGGTPGLPNDAEAGPGGGVPFSMSRPRPNPAVAAITVEMGFQSSTVMEIRVFDITGRTVLPVRTEIIGSGTHSLQISTELLGPGLYFLQAASAGRRLSCPFTVVAR